MAGASTSPLATTQRIEAGEARDLPPMTRLRAGRLDSSRGGECPFSFESHRTDGHSTSKLACYFSNRAWGRR